MNEMEAQISRLNLTILFISCKTAIHKVIQYLDLVSISSLYACYARQNAKKLINSGNPSGCQTHFITKILASYYYLKQNMMQVDRTFYYSIYECQEFTIIQNQQFVRLIELDNGFSELCQRRENVMQFVRSILRNAEAGQIIETLERMADDPEIPMGKLMRENVGAGCTSTFQQFLVALDPQEQCSLIPQLESLNQFFQQRVDNFYVKQFLTILSPKKHNDQMKIRILRFAPHEISYENYQGYQLPENELHNFIICLFLLAEEQILASQKYIEAIEDPHHRFLELMLRYSLFRNFVISVQEQFGFVFKTYNQLYDDTFNDCKMFPELCFWRPALANWFSKMCKYHRESNSLFGAYLLNERNSNSIKFLSENQETNPEKYAQVVNNCILLEQPTQKSQVAELLGEEMQVLVKEYSDYMIDLSIDEFSVFYCGHSQQQVSLPYRQFQETLLMINTEFINKIKKQIRSSHEVCLEIFKQDINFLFESQIVKSLTLTKFMKQIQENFGAQLDNIQVKQALEDMDSKLEYFNSKNQSIINITNNQKHFYQIVSDVSVKDILSKSFQTANTSNISEISQEPSMMYDSQGEDEQGSSKYLDKVMQVECEQFQQQVYEPPSQSQSEQIYYLNKDYEFYDQSSSLMEEQEEQINQIYHQIGRETDLC